MRLTVRVVDPERWSSRLDEAELEAKLGKGNRLVINLTRRDLDANRELLQEIIRTAIAEYEE